MKKLLFFLTILLMFGACNSKISSNKLEKDATKILIEEGALFDYKLGDLIQVNEFKHPEKGITELYVSFTNGGKYISTKFKQANVYSLKDIEEFKDYYNKGFLAIGRVEIQYYAKSDTYSTKGTSNIAAFLKSDSTEWEFVLSRRSKYNGLLLDVEAYYKSMKD